MRRERAGSLAIGAERHMKAALSILAKIYGAAVRRRNRRYDDGRATVYRVGAPVISVGNVSAGGTGKSPFVQMLVRELRELGWSAAIVSRGYGRSGKGERIISVGRSVNAGEVGDEPAMFAASLEAPVIVNHDKVAGCRTACERFRPDVIVVDDGFQHRRLHRDCDIVLLDGKTLADDALLPLGRLREPLTSLDRAHIVCTIGPLTPESAPSTLLRNDALVIGAEVQALPLREATAQAGYGKSVASSGAALAVSGIANPERFIDSLIKLGVTVTRRLEYRDHRRYDEKDCNDIIRTAQQSGVQRIVTTEKDIVKLTPYLADFTRSGLQLLTLPIAIQVSQGRDAFIQTLSETIRNT